MLSWKAKAYLANNKNFFTSQRRRGDRYTTILIALLVFCYVIVKLPESKIKEACIGTQSERVLITGAAGFIGFHTALTLKTNGFDVIGVDSFTDYYSVRLKKDRVRYLYDNASIRVIKADIGDHVAMCSLMTQCGGFDYVVHLAAQPGVKFSVHHPEKSIAQNVVKFMALLESLKKCNMHKRTKLVYASSSSVYGLNTKQPFEEEDRTDQPAAIYGASKKANELMMHSFWHLYNTSAIGLRFFTVYGPWGRPDMAVYKFAEAIRKGEPLYINVHPELGEFQRDFTFIEDITDGILASVERLGRVNESIYEIYNLGTSSVHRISEVVHHLQECLQRNATIHKMKSNRSFDVFATKASLKKSAEILKYSSKVPLKVGIERFCAWYRSYTNLDTTNGNNFSPMILKES